MVALEVRRPIWTFLFGARKQRVVERVETAAHLRSLDPATAALLMGRGSVPGSTTKAIGTTPAVGIETAPIAQETLPLTSEAQILPWSLLRNSGTFETDHHKTAIALAASAALLAIEMREKASSAKGTNGRDAVSDSSAIEMPAMTRLAAKLAAVARHNQPVGRSSGNAAFKSAAAHAADRAHERRASRRATQSRDLAVRSPANVIDLASVRTSRRSSAVTRAA